MVTGIIGIGTIGILGGCGAQNKLITQSFAIDKEVDNKTEETKSVENEVIKGSDIIPQGNIIHSAKDYSMKASDVSKILDNPYVGEEKKIFLTFDDGPSENTEKVIEVLEREGVHGTFFVLGDSLENEGADERLKETIQKGHAIANHTYTHDYKKLYPGGNVNTDTFF